MSHNYGSATKKYATEIEATMRDLFEKHDFGMLINDDILEKVFNSHFKNTFETNSAGSYIGPAQDSREKSNQLEIWLYEKYGNLLNRDKLREYNPLNPERQCGNITVLFKKDRITYTWTAGDSLGEHYQPSLVTDPKAVSYDDIGELHLPPKSTQTANKENFRNDNICYLEQQFHGDVTIDCVEFLAYPYDLMEKSHVQHLATAKKWQGIGAEVYYIKGGKPEEAIGTLLLFLFQPIFNQGL